MSLILEFEFVSADPKFTSAWSKWRREPGALKYNPTAEMNETQIAERLRREAGDFSALTDGKDIRWFVVREGSPVGTIGLEKIDTRMKSAMFGYQIGEEFSGKGLGSIIVKEFVHRLFANTDIERLTATVHHEHLASQRLLEKTGFKREGLLRQYLILNGKRADYFIYSILPGELVT